MNYRLEVIGQDATVVASEMIDRGADVIARVQTLRLEHPECDRIDVYGGLSKLFAINCDGVLI